MRGRRLDISASERPIGVLVLNLNGRLGVLMILLICLLTTVLDAIMSQVHRALKSMV